MNNINKLYPYQIGTKLDLENNVLKIENKTECDWFELTISLVDGYSEDLNILSKLNTMIGQNVTMFVKSFMNLDFGAGKLGDQVEKSINIVWIILIPQIKIFIGVGSMINIEQDCIWLITKTLPSLL